MTETTTKKTNLWDMLGAGQLPTVDIKTGVAIESASLVKIGATLFITACLIFAAYYAVKKIM